MSLEALNHGTLPAALVLCAAIVGLALSGRKNDVLSFVLGIIAVMATIRLLGGH